MHRRVVAAAAGSLLLAAALPAQRIVSSVDVSGTGVWYADSIHSAGSSLNPALRIDWANGTLGAFGNVSRVAGGVERAGHADAVDLHSECRPVQRELAASLGGSTHPDGTRTGQTLAVRARVHEPRRRWSVGRRRAGKNLGRRVWRGVRQAEVGAWAQRNGVTSLLTVTPVSVADSIRYTDVQAALRYPTRTLRARAHRSARAPARSVRPSGERRGPGGASAPSRGCRRCSRSSAARGPIPST